jgi:hypothetical protein
MMLKPVLREGESVLVDTGAVDRRPGHASKDGMTGLRVWLTNQRLLLQAGFNRQRSYPLYLLRKVGEKQIGIYRPVLLDFGEGQELLLDPMDKALFLNALQGARATAPTLPEGITSIRVNRTATRIVKILLAALALVFLLGMIVSVVMLVSVGSLIQQ